MSVLTATNISVLFGGLKAVEDFSIDIEQGELLGLIGPNGAGKTTVFNLLTGVYQPTTGSILLNGKDITGKKPAQIVGVGAARTFQNIRLFKEMSVIENVQVADNVNRTYGIAAALLRTKKYWAEEKASREKAMELLRVFDMETLADSPAKNLPYGKQRKLEIARALATNPTLLLLDEPAAGMNPTETTELMETIALIREKFKVAILLIEHDMSLVTGICERVSVLNFGTILAQGSPKEVTTNPEVIAAYLGE